MNKFTQSKIHGTGIGLRSCHYKTILETKPKVPWFEVLSDNYMIDGGPALENLLKIRQDYAVSMHGVAMSIGGTDPLNKEYLFKLKNLSKKLETTWVSDHLSFCSNNKQYLPDLLPLPYTEVAINHVVNRIKQIQDYLGFKIIIENVSSYIEYTYSDLTEWEFISEISTKADCNILLDINNIFVSSKNHNFDPLDYINNIPKDKVKQYHLGGYQDMGTYLFDNHSQAIHKPVWDLFKQATDIIGNKPTLIEWDQNIPNFEILLQEAKKANSFLRQKNELA
jgi:uncharacterized protein